MTLAVTNTSTAAQRSAMRLQMASNAAAAVAGHRGHDGDLVRGRAHSA
jgi:hypothetical protein